MVRVNLIEPKKLTDQHLIAEYNEILMLAGYAKKYPSLDGIPETYKLGPGHIKFFKNKLRYLKQRHEKIKREMKSRGFKTNKSLLLENFPASLKKSWSPEDKDFKVIKTRISQKIKLKPDYYRYYREKRTERFLLNLLN